MPVNCIHILKYILHGKLIHDSQILNKKVDLIKVVLFKSGFFSKEVKLLLESSWEGAIICHVNQSIFWPEHLVNCRTKLAWVLPLKRISLRSIYLRRTGRHCRVRRGDMRRQHYSAPGTSLQFFSQEFPNRDESLSFSGGGCRWRWLVYSQRSV